MRRGSGRLERIGLRAAAAADSAGARSVGGTDAASSCGLGAATRGAAAQFPRDGLADLVWLDDDGSCVARGAVGDGWCRELARFPLRSSVVWVGRIHSLQLAKCR